MVIRTRALVIPALLTVIFAAAHRTVGAHAPIRCTMQVVYTGAGAPNRLVLLATSTPTTEIAPGGIAVAPGRAEEDIFIGKPEATKFQVADIPPFVPQPFAAMIRRSFGTIWVVPWFRNSGCMLESSWLEQPTDRGLRAVLNLTPRPESLWVNGQPTFDTFDGSFSPHVIWETEPTSPTPMSLQDLKVYLALYPRLVGITRWAEPRDIDWAMAHRDSANTAALRGRFQQVTSGWARSALSKTMSPLAGVWRVDGELANGDSLHTWMWLPASPIELEWLTTSGPQRWYSGPAPFDTLPPGQYATRPEFFASRDPKATAASVFQAYMAVPFAASVTARSTPSWAWLARIAPENRRAEFAHTDSLERYTLKARQNELPPNPLIQDMTMNAAGDSLFARVTTHTYTNGLPVEIPIATWTAHRVP